MRKVLITGISGFVGIHLANFLSKNREITLYGTEFESSDSSRRLAIIAKNDIQLVNLDVTRLEAVRSVVENIDPDIIIHLAAQSNVPYSFKHPQQTFEVNVIGTINLYETVRTLEIDPLILSIGSAAEYGKVDPTAVPIRETHSLQPRDPYALSKVSMFYLSRFYSDIYGLKVIHTRGFNHLGPYQVTSFAIPSFCDQIARVEQGLSPAEMLVGNLEATRDFTDVRDVVRAYWGICRHGRVGEVYNVCSGEGHKMRDVLEQLLDLANVQITIKKDPSRLRPSDTPFLIGANEKLKEDTGWNPRIPLAQSLQDTLNYWRATLQNSSHKT